jgi:hypothetical protein
METTGRLIIFPAKNVGWNRRGSAQKKFPDPIYLPLMDGNKLKEKHRSFYNSLKLCSIYRQQPYPVYEIIRDWTITNFICKVLIFATVSSSGFKSPQKN